MEKHCVFCGDKPDEKSEEHVIPMWLIGLTGNPKRKAHFGYQLKENTIPKTRVFSFDSFKFPSCASCNQKYSALEAETKSVIEKMLTFDKLSDFDFNTLLNWLDKVRIGLWLGYQYLDKNPAGITPKYYIEKRLAVNDRMVAIFKTDKNVKGLNFVGCDFPSFTYTPSCFSLRINNIWLLNMSYNDLFSRRIGFPYPQASYAVNKKQEQGIFTWGRNRIMVPLLKKRLNIEGTEIYQPMFRYRNIDPAAKELYETQYVRDNSMIWEEGIGKIFIQHDRTIREYPSDPSIEYLPKITYNFQELWPKITIQTLESQQFIDSLAPSFAKLEFSERRHMMKQMELVRRLNQELHRILLKNKLKTE